MQERSVPAELLHSLKNVAGFDEKSFIDVHEHRRPVVSEEQRGLNLQVSRSHLSVLATKENSGILSSLSEMK